MMVLISLVEPVFTNLHNIASALLPYLQPDNTTEKQVLKLIDGF